MPRNGPVHLGVDVGTSGVRAVAVDSAGVVAALSSASLPPPLAVEVGSAGGRSCGGRR